MGFEIIGAQTQDTSPNVRIKNGSSTSNRPLVVSLKGSPKMRAQLAPLKGWQPKESVLGGSTQSPPYTDFGSLVQALYGIEEGISRGLWADSSPSDSKGKKPRSRPRPSIVGSIGMTRHWSPRHLPFQRQFSDTPYQMIPRDQYRPATPFRPTSPTYLHSPPQPVYAIQAPQRPHVQYHQQYRAPPPPRSIRQFTQLEMPLSRAFQRLVQGGLIVQLPPRPPPQPTPPGFRTDLHCVYH